MNVRRRTSWLRILPLLVLIPFAFLLLLTQTPTSASASPPADRTGSYNTGGFTFAAPQELTGHPPSNVFFQGDAEPEIKTDLFGNIYVTAIQGTPGGTDFWKSTDKGATFTYLGQPDGTQDHCATLPECLALGGGDDSIDVSNGGYLYVSALWLGNVTVSTSMDGGTGGVLPGQAWSVNPAAATIPGDDRQWLAHYGPQTVYLSYTDIGTGNLFVEKSTDAGKTFGTPVVATSGGLMSNLQGNMVVDQYNGTVYVVFIPVGGPNQVYIGKSTDGGATWTNIKAYQGPAAPSPNSHYDNGQVFPTMAVDRGGNIHIAFSRCLVTTVGTTDNHSQCQIYMVSSTDGGNNWLDAVRVSNGASTATAVEPWIAAGSAGHVDVVWLGSSTLTPDDITHPSWHVFFAQTANALSATPTFNQVQAETATMHDQDICFNGLACAANPSQSPGNRDLLEYFQVTVDPDGNANIAYADSVNNCDPSTCITNTWFTKQTSGASAYAPPSGPAAASFMANYKIDPGQRGGEPGIYVDTHNCIYVNAIDTNAGEPGVWKSQNGGTSFENRGNLPNIGGGGDADLITIPNPTPSAPDIVYVSDLAVADIMVNKSTDGGQTFPPAPGAASQASASSDRMWWAYDKNGANQIMYQVDHEFVSEEIRVLKSTNDGAWTQVLASNDPELTTGNNANTNPGTIFVNPTTHAVFTVFGASTNQTNVNNPPFGKLLNAWIAVSTDGGTTFTDHPIFKGMVDSPSTAPAATKTYGTSVAQIFPVAKMDSAGNIYVVWSMNNARNNHFDIWYAVSRDQGQNFYGPFQVSQDVGTHVLPWLSAGDDGRIDVTWYGTSNVGDPNDTTAMTGAAWSVFFAQSLNARDRESSFTQVQAGDHINHHGTISTGGLFGSADRTLLDFFQNALDRGGNLNIIYADDGSTPGNETLSYTKQVSGPVAYTNPSSPTCVTGATSTPTFTPTNTPTGTITPPTNTPTRTPTQTRTPTNTPTRTNTPTNTPTRTNTPTGTITPPTSTPTATGTITPVACEGASVEDTNLKVQYNGWRGVFDPAASGSSYRIDKITKDKAKFKFSGGKITWITYMGPDQGIADVVIDGVDKGNVDLYSASPQYQVPETYNGLGSANHVIYVKVTGTKNASSSDTNVVVDAFTYQSTTEQDDSPRVKYNNWKGKFNSSASGGTFRKGGSHAADTMLTFDGTSIAWITARGPSSGKAKVFIDSVNKGTFDLYHSTQEFQHVICFQNLGAGQHTIQIIPTHTKNPSSNRYSVVVDAFRGPITAFFAAANAKLDVDAAPDGEVIGVVKAVNPQTPGGNGTLTIQPNDGSKAIRLKVNDSSQLEVNDNDVSLSDIRVGMLVDIEYDTASKTVTTVDATDLNAPDASPESDSQSLDTGANPASDLLSWLSALLFGN
jgi:hypothetical protein